MKKRDRGGRIGQEKVEEIFITIPVITDDGKSPRRRRSSVRPTEDVVEPTSVTSHGYREELRSRHQDRLGT